jgi:sulfide:quinone oxidoreductase
MNFARLSDRYSVAPQIQPADIVFFAEQGFTTVICNRPDGEDAGQPSAESIRMACEQHGIEFHLIPMSGRRVGEDTVDQFLDVMKSTEGPVLGYCRSGTRSAILWQMASQKAGTLP